jgi:alpha-beta hydrolase superfamily lysophospholipase
VIHHHGTFTGLGGLSIFYQRWLPDGKLHSGILLAHGYAEHSSRYDTLVEHIVPQGYGVFAIDHRGHGQSEGERVHVDSFDDYVIDLKTHFDTVTREYPALPMHLLGHSMGAFIAILYAARYQHELVGLVLSGGGLGSGRPASNAPTTPVDLAATISRDPAVVQAYRDDPLVFHDPPPPSRAPAMRGLRARAGAATAITLPTLIMAGGASPLGEGEGSRRLFETISSEDKTLKVYDGLMHEIFNEPEREIVFADLDAWLKAHTG